MNRFTRVSGTTLAVLELLKIFLALAGVFIVVDDGSQAYEAYSSQFWPTTTGEITRSSVEAYGASIESRTYRSKVKYTYAVGQPTRDDDYLISERVRVYPFSRVDNRAIAESRLKPYPKGSPVEVYYNPNRPEKSILEPDFSLTYLIMPVVGLFCVVAAVGLWVVGRT